MDANLGGFLKLTNELSGARHWRVRCSRMLGLVTRNCRSKAFARLPLNI